MKFNVSFPQTAFSLHLNAAVFVLVLLTGICAAQENILTQQKVAVESKAEADYDTNAKKLAYDNERSFSDLYKKRITASKHFGPKPHNLNVIYRPSDLNTNLNNNGTRRFFSSAKRGGDSYKPIVVDDLPLEEGNDEAVPQGNESFRWGSAIKQSLLFLSIQHGYALTQSKTRRSLEGNFFKDYASSVKSLHGWNDGGRFFTNYIAHPLQGSFMGFIQIQNDPKGMKQRFGPSAGYWKSRMKAMAWSAAWSTQFEIGPVSQASIGNVGFYGKQTWIDLVITPTVGTAFLITEDALDRFVVERIERMSDNYYLMAFARMLLNPTRTMANIVRFKLPWYRDRKRLH